MNVSDGIIFKIRSSENRKRMTRDFFLPEIILAKMPLVKCNLNTCYKCYLINLCAKEKMFLANFSKTPSKFVKNH